jgi:hypothetical protein
MIKIQFVILAVVLAIAGYWIFPVVRPAQYLISVGLVGIAVMPPVIGALVARLFDRLEKSLDKAAQIDPNQLVRITQHVGAWQGRLVNAWMVMVCLCVICAGAAALLGNDHLGETFHHASFSVAVGAVALIVCLLVKTNGVFHDEIQFRSDIVAEIEQERASAMLVADLTPNLPPAA